MNTFDFPALYAAADDASNKSQRELLILSAANSILLILGAFFSLYRNTSQCLTILGAVCFLASLFILIYLKYEALQDKWYQARALAESVKTASWRLVMNAEPFNKDTENENLETFQKLLSELLQQNQNIGNYLAGKFSEGEQISPTMLDHLRLSYDEKNSLYLNNRIEDQKKWYAKKSGDNRSSSKYWFIALCFVYACAIVVLFVQTANPKLQYLPVDILAVVAGSIIGWMQIKRYDELASSYGVTAHEIGIIKSRFSAVKTPEHLSNFVSDAENAFSREHTLWAARRDH
jgi:hypothetical protein